MAASAARAEKAATRMRWLQGGLELLPPPFVAARGCGLLEPSAAATSIRAAGATGPDERRECGAPGGTAR